MGGFLVPHPDPLKCYIQGVGLPIRGVSALPVRNALMFVATVAAMGIMVATPVGITKVPSYLAPCLGAPTPPVVSSLLVSSIHPGP